MGLRGRIYHETGEEGILVSVCQWGKALIWKYPPLPRIIAQPQTLSLLSAQAIRLGKFKTYVVNINPLAPEWPINSPLLSLTY